MKNFRLLIQALTPKAGALTFAWIALGLCLVGGSCSLYLATQIDQPFLVSVGAYQGLFVLPVCALLMALGAWLEKRPGPRTVLLVGVWFLLALAGILLVGGMALDPTAQAGLASFGGLFFCAPVLLLISGLVVLYAARAWPDLRKLQENARLQRAAEMVIARGEITFSDLARELEMPLSEVDNVLDELVRSGRVQGVLDLERQRFSTQTVLEQKRQSLPGIIQAKGQATLAELGVELNASPAQIKDWIYQLVQQRMFSGYINWQEGILYSQEADKLRSLNACPKCGGSLSLAGMGIVHCQYCGAEIFL